MKKTKRIPLTIFYDVVSGQFYPTADAVFPFRIAHDSAIPRARSVNLDLFALTRCIEIAEEVPEDTDTWATLRAAIARSNISPRLFPEGWRTEHKSEVPPTAKIKVRTT